MDSDGVHVENQGFLEDSKTGSGRLVIIPRKEGREHHSLLYPSIQNIFLERMLLGAGRTVMGKKDVFLQFWSLQFREERPKKKKKLECGQCYETNRKMVRSLSHSVLVQLRLFGFIMLVLKAPLHTLCVI